MLALLAALGLCLLPRRWREALTREGLHLTIATVVTAALELGVAVSIGPPLLARYQHQFMQQLGDATLQNGINEADLMGFGAMCFIRFLFTAAGMVIAWLFVEGIIRAFGALITGDAIGTLPVWLLALGVDGVERWRDHLRHPPVADKALLTPREDGGEGGGVLTIESCLRRPWDADTTLRHGDGFYQLAGFENRGPGVRPFVYRFTALPEKQLIRHLTAWDPDEALRLPPPDRRILSGVRAQLADFFEKRQPLVEDTVSGDGTEMIVQTCRRREWTALDTLEINGSLYTVASYEHRPVGPRRHVYRLRAAPPEHVVRRLERYDPGALVLRGRD
jgi:hypothetical protein